MTRTTFGTPGMPDRQVAVRYGASRQRVAPYKRSHPRASAAYSTASDLARFGAFHLKHLMRGQRPILSEATRDPMQQANLAPGGATFESGVFTGALRSEFDGF